ncbi:MAG: site-specific integrase, partial [Lachnospiraceae bacterium]|nr:site-specific integrase [Lachnospiraceae bacterium]
GNNIRFNDWFEHWWTKYKVGNVKESTSDQYKKNYNNYIRDVIGDMSLVDIKPIHCQEVLNKMAQTELSTGTINIVRIMLHSIFEIAVENDMIIKNPVQSSVKQKGIDAKDKFVPNIFLQKRLIQALEKEKCYNLFALDLQTGLRVGELTSLKWSDINFEERYLTVNRTVYYSIKEHDFIETTPKTKNSIRKVPLTEEAIKILLDQKHKQKRIKKTYLIFNDYVFLSREGKPFANHHLNRRLYDVCKKLEIPQMSMHCLRHTFATRCIESGMKPKTLQRILGHANIQTTLDLYVHVTDDELFSEIKKFEYLA